MNKRMDNRLPAAQRNLAGLRIRERRRELGIKQVDLAKMVSISPAYLNLIERNKRTVGGALLNRIGRRLSLSPDQLDGATERRLLADLTGMSGEPELQDTGGQPEAPEELIARFPAWARLTASLHSRWRTAVSEAEMMANMLTHDPTLAASLHEVLTQISALRSTAEILAENPDLPPEQRNSFEQTMYELSSSLATTGTGLATYFDEAADARKRRMPAGIVEDILERTSGLSDRIEELAEEIRPADDAKTDFEFALTKKLKKAPRFPPETSRAARLSALALACAQTTGAGPLEELAKTLLEKAVLPDDMEQEKVLLPVLAGLTQRLADAILQPARDFLALGKKLDWDITAMTDALDGDAPLAMRRAACLGGEAAPRAAYVAADASGSVISRYGAPDIVTGSIRIDCPVWPVNRVRHGPLRTTLRYPDGVRLNATAILRRDGMAADMYVTEADESAGAGSDENVGPGCRICAHADCPWRREAGVIL